MIVTEGSLPCWLNVRSATAFFFRSAYWGSNARLSPGTRDTHAFRQATASVL